MNDALERIAGLVDRLDNANAMLQNKSLPAAIHVEAMRSIVPEVAAELRAECVRLGCNPWGDK